MADTVPGWMIEEADQVPDSLRIYGWAVAGEASRIPGPRLYPGDDRVLTCNQIDRELRQLKRGCETELGDCPVLDANPCLYKQPSDHMQFDRRPKSDGEVLFKFQSASVVMTLIDVLR